MDIKEHAPKSFIITHLSYIHGALQQELKCARFVKQRDVGRYTLRPVTTKENNNKFNRKTNQSCRKMKLYGSLTTKESKKKHSLRLLGGAETGS